ncbi:MAG: aminopeptidase P family protein [Propionibacteriaceae bacterium]|jgi:Xaa-Pro aminopeptidase|nr:aminopeptidase P family protein [Propionibacteriaceae bacterium]
MSEKQVKSANRATYFSAAFREFIATDWQPYPDTMPARLENTNWAAARRAALSKLFPGDRLIIPAGGMKVRSNDTDFRYRPHTAFAHLTGLGTEHEPDAVLLLEPQGDGHQATLYFHPRVPRTDPEFYSDSRYGEMWVGQRESLEEMSALTGLPCQSIALFDNALRRSADTVTMRVIRDADPDITAMVDSLRESIAEGLDEQLRIATSELRLIKDDYEIDQMRKACEATARGFEAVTADFPNAVLNGRGERWVEGIFGLHARHQGNAVGYDTIAASGDHANTLHWIRNDGCLKEGDLILIDAGVELDSLFTADVTRTLPVNGKFSPAQRQVYEAVLAAQQAGIDAAKPGVTFDDIHKAATAVLAYYLEQWGLLPVSASEALSDEGGQWRRWMVHGTSHMLGMDVHDCAQALREHYKQGPLQVGMVLTVEPGLYFKSTDLKVPEELRGIGVRIEDDIVITETGCELLSGSLPRTPDDVEAWMAPLLERGRQTTRKW